MDFFARDVSGGTGRPNRQSVGAEQPFRLSPVPLVNLGMTINEVGSETPESVLGLIRCLLFTEVGFVRWILAVGDLPR